MKRVGILGGTFNPIHIGHLSIAHVAYEKLQLDKVVLVPSYLPPHKTSKNVISAHHRYQLVVQAIEGNPSFEVSDFEIKKEGKSYSIDTVRYLRDQYPKGTKLYFIIGYDSLATLDTWKDIDEILKIVTFVVVNRPGFGKIQSSIKTRVITMPGIDVSSSYVRRCLSSGHPAKYFLPEKVLTYINEHRLYGVQ